MSEANREDDFNLEDIKIHSAEVVDKPMHGSPYARPVEIIVEAAAWSHMNQHAREDLRYEAGGVMLGGIYELDGTLVVRITTAVAARGAVNNVASIQFTYDAWSQMEKERQQRAPAEKLLGWYHTHPGFSAFFSDTDRFMHEHFFTQPWHVALVIDPLRGEHRFFRWDGGGVQEVREFLLQVDQWPGPQPPLNAVLSTALRQAARQAAGRDGDGAATPLAPALEELVRSLRRGSSEQPLSDLLPFIVACAGLDPEVLSEARRRIEVERSPDSPIRLADLEVCSNNNRPDGAITIAQGWLAQQRDHRRLHVHSLDESQPLCTELEVPLPVYDLAVSDRGNLLVLTRERDRPLYCVQPPLALLRGLRQGGRVKAGSVAAVDVDWGDRRPPTKIGKFLAARHDLYLLTRTELWLLAGRGSGEVPSFDCAGVHGSLACGWESFDELVDWTCDPLGNLYLLGEGRKEVWRFERLTDRWSRFVADPELDAPRSIAAGMTTLSVYDAGQAPAIAQYDLSDGRLQCRRRLEADLRRLRLWHLFSDGYQRLYMVTDRYVFKAE
jgi:proteasome lid subunit RPN8/RPN11